MKKLQTFKKTFKIRHSLKRDGSLVETQYVLHLNNDEPRYFLKKSDLSEFLSQYARTNQIFTVHTFRVDVYSLM